MITNTNNNIQMNHQMHKDRGQRREVISFSSVTIAGVSGLLNELKQLRADGVLSLEEFEAKKNRLFSLR